MGQNTFYAIIKDHETKVLLVGTRAYVHGTSIGTIADKAGIIEMNNISNGKQIIAFSLEGYETHTQTLYFPLADADTLIVLLKSFEEDLEEVVVATTRSSRTISDIPTRIETISGEELDEKGNMKPGEIRMMLSESTGIQTQQTSATSYNSSIRIQGLDGKYTQIIRDGFPLYSGFSGGLGLLQIVPLDLKQVEVIKGGASTLYGGGAIAGLVNLISKTPKEIREFNFLINGTSALGLDASGFFSQKFKKIGTTIFASYNHGTPYDPANIGFTAIPNFDRYTLNPKLYYYFSKKTTVYFGLNTTFENRIGGDIHYIDKSNDSAHTYFEKNKTNRFSTQLSVEHVLNDKIKLNLKNSVSYYNRSIQIPDYLFSGTQVATFSEVDCNYKTTSSEWVGGINFITDKFTQDKHNNIIPVNYNQYTLGAFLQNTTNVNPKIALETGFRCDYHSTYGVLLLPRLSALFKINNQFSSRIGGGLGYKTPTVFTEDAERIQFKNVLPIDETNAIAEKSYGGGLDMNYRTGLFQQAVFLSVNQLFFYTRINHPLVLTPIVSGYYNFLQPHGFIDTRGFETNIKLTFKKFKLFIGYTFSDVNQHYTTTTQYPLVASHRLNNVLFYEVEDKLKIGLEAYYYSPQKLNDGTTGKAFWLAGFMIEKLWDHFSIYANFENFFDTRQTNFDAIYTGSINNPIFKDIYAPLDGFVMNGGIKLKL